MIPKLLHLIWVGDDRRRPDQLIQTWLDQHPDWEIKLWSNEDLVQHPWQLRSQMRALGEMDCAAVAAAMKWEILLDKGGFVVPVDSVCLRPIPHDWLCHTMVAMWEQETVHPGLISSSYVGCKPGNPLVTQIVERIARDEQLADQSISQAVGAQRLTDTYFSMGYRNLHILPSQVFHPLHPDLDVSSYERTITVAIELFSSRLGLLDSLSRITPHDVTKMLGFTHADPTDSAPPKPLFSVVIPTFNRLHTIAEAIISVTEQAASDTEIVVVDDGSTDGTFEKLAPHISQVFRVIRQGNAGAPAARNKGISHARGEYIVWLDSDDILLPGALDGYRQILRQTANRPDILYGNLQVLDIQTGQRSRWQYPEIDQNKQFPQLLEANRYPNPGTAVRAGLYTEIGTYNCDLDASEDYDMWIRAAATGAKFRRIPLDVCEYRISKNSLSSCQEKNKRADAKLVNKALKTYQWNILFPHLDWQKEQEARANGQLEAAKLMASRQAWREVAEFAAGLQINACELSGVAEVSPSQPPATQSSDASSKLQNIREQFTAFKEYRPSRFNIDWEDRWLCLDDNTDSTDFDRHYIFHTAWACRVLARTRPSRHIDIASSLNFVSQISAFINTEFYDVRPVEMKIPGLKCAEGNLTKLPFPDNSIESLSCMHVIEHVGLARYGDTLDYDGDLKAITEIQRVIKKGGALLFVVPIGGEARIQFNAHRIYTYQQIIHQFQGWQLQEFALIPDSPTEGDLIINATKEQASKQKYGCGCFLFIK